MWTPPITWLAGQELDAATLDEQVRDNLKALTEYDAFTPVLHSSGTAVTVSAASGGVIHAGNVVDGWFELTINAPGTGSYTLDMPVAAASHWFPKPFGIGTCINGSGGFYPMQLICTGSTTIAAMAQSGSARVTQTSPFTFAAGHVICGTFHYEAA